VEPLTSASVSTYETHGDGTKDLDAELQRRVGGWKTDLLTPSFSTTRPVS